MKFVNPIGRNTWNQVVQPRACMCTMDNAGYRGNDDGCVIVAVAVVAKEISYR